METVVKTEVVKQEVDLKTIDLSSSQHFIQYFEDEDGNLCSIEHTYIPKISLFRTDVYEGTWTCSYQGVTVFMSYTFDVTKSGSQWKISKARNHTYSAPFVSFSDPSLYISRSTSTSSFPAEINAQVTCAYFDFGWVGPIYSNVWTMYSTITSGGVLTTYHN